MQAVALVDLQLVLKLVVLVEEEDLDLPELSSLAAAVEVPLMVVQHLLVDLVSSSFVT
jgi:hypothetical protein